MLFVLICELQSFSKAASVIGQTQSSVSRRIDAFERKLGLTLFNRTVRPIAPTQEGRVLFHEINHHADALEETVGRFRIKNALNPVIHIGCVESLSLDLIPKLIKSCFPLPRVFCRLPPRPIRLSNTCLNTNSISSFQVICFRGFRGSIAGSYFGSRRYCYYPRQWLRAKRARGRGPIFGFAANPTSIITRKAAAGGSMRRIFPRKIFLFRTKLKLIPMP